MAELQQKIELDTLVKLILFLIFAGVIIAVFLYIRSTLLPKP
jgi:hypothetical protein